MKRSNKLLTGLLIVIFILPFGIFMAFKKMVKEGAYTSIRAITNGHMGNWKPGHYSVVKISGPNVENNNSGQILTCRLHSAKEGYYNFVNLDSMERFSVTNERDTLFINPYSNSTRSYILLHDIDLYLPDMKDIIVNRATLQMDSIDVVSNPDIAIHLNNAVLQLGDKIEDNDDSNVPLKIRQKLGIDTDKAPATLRYSNLSITADASHVILGNFLQIDTLSLAIREKSRLSIANGLQARQITGTISNETTIVSNLQNIEKLKRLHIDKD